MSQSHAAASAASAAPPFLDAPSVSAALEARLVPLTVAIERALIAYSCGLVVQPVRSLVPIDAFGGAMLTMPAYLPPDHGNDAYETGETDIGVLGHKTVTVYPRNAALSPPLASHHAIVTLMRPDSGQVRAILDATTLTAWRTAAASAAAVRCFLCAPSPHTRASDLNIAVIGAGVQAASHIRLLCAPGCLPGRRVARIAVCARSSSSSAALVDSLRSVPPFSSSPESVAVGQGAPALTIATIVAAACDGADLIVCCTSSAAPILHADDLLAARGLVLERGASHDDSPRRRRVLIVAVGAWRPTERELASSVIDAAAAFCVDSRAAAAAESGDALLSTRGAQRIDAELGAVIPLAQWFWSQHDESTSSKQFMSSARDNDSTSLDGPAQSTGVVPLSALGLAASCGNGTEWVVFKSLGQAFEDLAATALVCDALHVK